MLVLFAAQNPSTDLEFLEADLKKALSGLPWDSLSDTVYLAAEAPKDPWSWFVEECLIGVAMESDKEVVRGRASGTMISYRVGELGITYAIQKGLFPWSGKKLIRKSRFRIYLTATGVDSVVIWNETLAGGRTEDLDWKWRQAIRVKGLSPEIDENPGTGIAEPLLTAVILGGLLYVFYSFESR
ncbi:MAG: hypothetical protein ACPL68_02400, partial [Candidatus Hydrothermia bacterium]